MFGRWDGRGGRRGDGTGTLDRPATKDDTLHLRRFAAAHSGVEAFLEPATTVTGKDRCRPPGLRGPAG